MTLPRRLRSFLPARTVRVWEALVDVVPPEAYLVGGTALAAHLVHRESRDFDFLLESPVDLDRLERNLGRVGLVAVEARAEGTLNCVVGATRVQFLDASDQRLVEPTVVIGGLRVAGLGDLLATKLKVVVDRPALRDYFDLQRIEQVAGRHVEEGLALFVERYRPRVPDQAVRAVVQALAAFDDVPEDPGLPVDVGEMGRYWTERIREIVAHLDRWGLEPPRS